MAPIDIRSWISDLTERLKAIFGGRLVYVGLQGSYRRGEADAQSDIDVMTVLDRLEPADLKTYRAAVGAMPYADKACGFICGRAELAAWPRHELFLLQRETLDCFGALAPLLPAVQDGDIRTYVQINAANLYHAVCHRALYAAEPANANALNSAYKPVFYILQNLAYLKSGVFASTKNELLPLLTGIDREVLLAAVALRSGEADDRDSERLFSLLFRWCQTTLHAAADETGGVR